MKWIKNKYCGKHSWITTEKPLCCVWIIFDNEFYIVKNDFLFPHSRQFITVEEALKYAYDIMKQI
jgi:hypothetical protein